MANTAKGELTRKITQAIDLLKIAGTAAAKQENGTKSQGTVCRRNLRLAKKIITEVTNASKTYGVTPAE